MARVVPEELLQEWQGIVDLTTRIMNVSAGLIMRINEDDIEVFVSSHNDKNPYKVGDKEHLRGASLYCETVINKQAKLLVPNALEAAEWKNNPDVKLGMISYLGFPIYWPDGKPFGTICVLDAKGNRYSPEFEELLGKFRDLIQKHLEIIEINHQLKILSEIDPLTGVLNRRAFFNRAEMEIERTARYKKKLSMLILDVDHFKQINDRFGHQAGDDVLKELTKKVMASLRRNDTFGRLGGDDLLLCSRK
jgi:predicted signal transduction protein with EAL and GGDEF domain